MRLLLVTCALGLLACTSDDETAGDGSTRADGPTSGDARRGDAAVADAPTSSQIDAHPGGAPDAHPGGTPDAHPGGTPDAPPAISTANLYFPSGAVWTQDISQAAPDDESDSVIDDLAAVGWGNGGIMQIDFSIVVLRDDGSAPTRSFTAWNPFFFTPDCDTAAVPVPTWGTIEDEDGLACTHGGDCHLIVAEADRLYEMWKADVGASSFRGGCLAIWDRTRVYAATGRGDGCSSADAAGYPIAALLFNADEVAAGHIDHAIRFILPNDRIRPGFYVHPATHTTDVTGSAAAIPYGARLRLRPDYPLGNLEPGARVVAQAMQKYGMFLADGGNIALTAESDRFTAAKWDGLLAPRDLDALGVRDFVMVDGGPRVTYGDCTRTPIGD